eukprot:6023200-Prymnesium_polylepis.2
MEKGRCDKVGTGTGARPRVLCEVDARLVMVKDGVDVGAALDGRQSDCAARAAKRTAPASWTGADGFARPQQLSLIHI